MNETIAILGSGDHGHVVWDALNAAGRSSAVACLVNLAEDAPAGVQSWRGCRVVPDWQSFVANRAFGATHFVIALGSIERRRQIFPEAISLGLKPTIIRHPAAVISETVVIGRGTQVSAGVVVGVEASIGENCLIHTASSISHDTRIANLVNINPRACLAGRVTVGEGTTIGAGAVVIDRIQIGARSFVAAGAVVIRDVPDEVLVAGVPAVIKRRLVA